MKKQIVPVVIAAIVNEKNKFLMTKRVHLDPEDYHFYHDTWQLPGGGIEFGEKPEEALQREMKEEIGTEVKILGLLPKIFSEKRKNWQGIFIVYLCRLKNQKVKITLNSEASEFGWYAINQARRLKTLSGTVEIMKEALSFLEKLAGKK